MGLFGFGKKHKQDEVHESPEAVEEKSLEKDEAIDTAEISEDLSKKSDSELVVTQGPWDIEDDNVIDYRDYLDVGAMRLPCLPGMELRVKSNSQTQEIMGVTISYGKSSLELEAFAAPKSLGLWELVRNDLKKSNPKAREVEGSIGAELILPVSVKGKEFTTRIVGVDGPRWMLRGIFSGPAATKGEEKNTLDEYFTQIVVDRGQEPLAPRDLIPMHDPIVPDQNEVSHDEEEDTSAEQSNIPDKPQGPLDSDQQTQVKTTLSRGPMFSEVR